MNRSDKIKRIALVFLGALASGYFIYSGFSLLMSEDEMTSQPSQSPTPLSK